MMMNELKNKTEPTSQELLRTIFEYINKIANERDVDKLLIVLADMGRDLVTADRCTVWLADHKNGKLWSKVAHGIDRIVIDITQGVAGLVASTGEATIINDAYKDDRFDERVDQKTGYHTRNILALPIRNSEGEIIGVYQAINKMTEAGVFSNNDLEHLMLAASYTGRQLESVMLQEEIQKTQREIVFTLAETGEMRSKETGNHVKRVASFSAEIAKTYGLDDQEVELLRDASPMHDIGKIAIPDAVLLKKGSLSDEERETMKSHTELGYDMLRHSERELLKAASEVALQHHERWDGKGYPNGLSGKDIHIFGRITSVADVLDALSCERVYKDAWPREKVEEVLWQDSGTAFDPDIIGVYFDIADTLWKIRDENQ